MRATSVLVFATILATEDIAKFDRLQPYMLMVRLLRENTLCSNVLDNFIV
jgi:hypothetical protein